MWLHPPPTRYSYWESEFVGKLLHNAASTAERGDKLHTYSTLWTQLAKKGLVSVPDLARGGDSGEAGVHKILNTVEFRWDESDWLIAIVSTFPTVFYHEHIYVSNMANWSAIEIETWLSPGLDTLQRIQTLYTLTTTWGGHQIHRQVGPKLWHDYPVCNLSPSHGLPMVFLVLLDAHQVL